MDLVFLGVVRVRVSGGWFGREFWGRDLGMAWGCLGGCDQCSEGV